MKRCSRCGKRKPSDQFCADSHGGRSGLSSRCRSCLAEATAQWRKDNHERFLELERARRPYKREHENNARRACPECGKPMGPGSGYPKGLGRVCRECRVAKLNEQRRHRCERIQALWLAGKTLKEIAEALDSTPGSIGVSVTHMRQEGWNVPHRCRRKVAA